MYHCGCHGNSVAIAMKYVPDAYHTKNSHTKYGLTMTKDKRETYHYGCHGNLVTIAMKYVPNAYHPKEPSYQRWA